MDPYRKKCIWPKVEILFFIYDTGQRLVSQLLLACLSQCASPLMFFTPIGLTTLAC